MNEPLSVTLELHPADIVVGRFYQAKRPSASPGLLVNDRQVRWISSDRSLVQYDSPSLPDGRHYPKVTMEAFLKWAALDVTELMPKDSWRSWLDYRAQKRAARRKSV